MIFKSTNDMNLKKIVKYFFTEKQRQKRKKT